MIYIRDINEGSFGKVKLYKSTKDRKLYAIKTLIQTDTRKIDIVVERIILEKYNGCIFINKCHDIFFKNDELSFVLDYEAGGDMFGLLHDQFDGIMDEETCKFYVLEIALGLSYLHSHGIIYRDLKLENVLLSATGHIKLCDFGLSCLTDINRETVCGTMDYFSPEMINGIGYSNKIDVWNLGIILFEMITGNPPFSNRTLIRQFSNTLIGKINKYDNNFMSTDVQNLLHEHLLKPEDERYDIDQVLKHKWFNDMNIDEISIGIYANIPFIPEYVDEGNIGVEEGITEYIDGSIKEGIMNRMRESIAVTDNSIQERIHECIQDCIQERIEERIEECIQERIQECIEERIEERIEECIEERIQERIQERIEERIEERIDGKIFEYKLSFDNIPCMILIFCSQTHGLLYANKLATTHMNIPEYSGIKINNLTDLHNNTCEEIIEIYLENISKPINFKIVGTSNFTQCIIEIIKYDCDELFIKCIPVIKSISTHDFT